MDCGNMQSFNPSSTRLTPSKEKEYQEPKADQDFTEVLKDILVPNISQNENNFKINNNDVTMECFAYRLYSEVINHLVNSSQVNSRYTFTELKEKPDLLSYELIDCLNEVIMYGEEVNQVSFKVKTKDHWKTFKEVMKLLEIVMEEQ